MKLKTGLCILGIIAIGQSTFAKDLFQAEIIIDGQKVPYQTYDNVLDMADQYSSKHLKQIFPAYTNNSALDAKITYLGLSDIRVTFEENSNKLSLSIPSANVYKEFDRDTRNESRKDMIKFLKTAPKNLTTALVESSYQHPVNQNRIDIINSTYDVNTASTDIMMYQDMNTFESALSIVPRFGRYTQNGLDTDVITLPLTYSKWLKDENYMLLIDAPVTVSKTNESWAGQGSFGIGINSAVNENWYLMPMLRVGATIAPDYGVSSSLFGTSVTSNYRFKLNPATALNMVNIISYYHTGSLEIEDYNSKYDLDNFVFRNGLELSYRLNKQVLNNAVMVKGHFARTDYTGDAVYSKYSHDMGGSIGFYKEDPKAFLNNFRIGFNYTKGDKDVESFSVNTGYTF